MGTVVVYANMRLSLRRGVLRDRAMYMVLMWGFGGIVCVNDDINRSRNITGAQIWTRVEYEPKGFLEVAARIYR